jgi:hypothetical protein
LKKIFKASSKPSFAVVSVSPKVDKFSAGQKET